MNSFIVTLFTALDSFENILWGYIAVPILLALGLLLTYQSGFVQIRKFPAVVKIFAGFFRTHNDKKTGVHPIKVFFACVGGCVGVGNIVGICTAVQIGGPGALLWIWLTAIVGMVIKYSEVFLGLRYRIPNNQGGYDGGPMYFLQRVFKGKTMPAVAALLLCIYGVEIYQFSVVTDAIATNFEVSQLFVTSFLLVLVIYAGMGGVRRVGNIASTIIPFLVVIYVGMSLYVLHQHFDALPRVIGDVFSSAFGTSAAVGGFVGSTLIMTMSQGIRRGCYTGDLGVGYASIIHSESSVKIPEKQAALVIFDIFLDTFMVCTSSLMVILATGVWNKSMSANMLVQTALQMHFPYMHIFMPLFLFLLGYSTINAYFCAGIKCAQYLHPKWGRPVYFVYAATVLAVFSFVDSTQAQTVMTIAGGLLLVLNSYGIYKLRNEISFDIEADEPSHAIEPVLAQEG